MSVAEQRDTKRSNREEDISTQQAASSQEAWLPGAYGDEGRTERFALSPQQESSAAFRLESDQATQTSDTQTFIDQASSPLSANMHIPGATRTQLASLKANSRRVRRGDVTIRWNCEASTTTRAFAIPRSYGNAVTRNRVRRQLHHLLVDFERQTPLDGCLMLISVRRSSTTPDSLERHPTSDFSWCLSKILAERADAPDKSDSARVGGPSR